MNPIRFLNIPVWSAVSVFLFSPFTQCNTDPARGITFLNESPVIDGQLDSNLQFLDANEFNYIWQFNNPVTDTVPVTYRIGYTSTHFYIYIETKTDSITHRNRGFINGDGFKLLLGIPQRDSLTNEFYELVFSASTDKKYKDRQRIWEYNKKQVHKGFSKETLFEEKSSNGTCGFEALIAWKDIAPYHPWFLPEMGYNLYFVKAIGDTIANGYAVVSDEGIWDEEIPKRKYQIINFNNPASVDEQIILANSRKRNLHTDEPLIIQTAGIGKKTATVKLWVTITTASANAVFNSTLTIPVHQTLTKNNTNLPIGSLPSGNYNLIIRSSTDTLTHQKITILPTIDFNLISSTIHENQHGLEIGTVNTLLFSINELQQMLGQLKEYETGSEFLNHWNAFQHVYTLFLKGTEPYQVFGAPYRRAFKSKYDDTYQPYSIKLPLGYDPRKKYPLLVFLHGSGSDEQGLLNLPRSGGNFIELAPLARDIYYCYSSDQSQKDIVEAIDDVSRHFPVDKGKIIIGGFSMGGYGALRTYYEHPELYKGIAVFAGHPHLASDWLGEEHPDFLKNKYLADFLNIPVFIYHGRKDGALPLNKIEKLIVKLRSAGAIVTERIIDNKGHEYPDKETNDLYFHWLNNIPQH